MQDIRKLAEDLRSKSDEVRRLQKKIPRYVAAAAEKMKDANFSAQGFVENGSTRPRGKKSKREKHADGASCTVTETYKTTSGRKHLPTG